MHPVTARHDPRHDPSRRIDERHVGCGRTPHVTAVTAGSESRERQRPEHRPGRLARTGSEVADEFGERNLQSLGDSLGSHDGRRVPAQLDLAQVPRIESWDPAGDVLKRLPARLSCLADRRPERLSDRISAGPPRHLRS